MFVILKKALSFLYRNKHKKVAQKIQNKV